MTRRVEVSSYPKSNTHAVAVCLPGDAAQKRNIYLNNYWNTYFCVRLKNTFLQEWRKYFKASNAWSDVENLYCHVRFHTVPVSQNFFMCFENFRKIRLNKYLLFLKIRIIHIICLFSSCFEIRIRNHQDSMISYVFFCKFLLLYKSAER